MVSGRLMSYEEARQLNMVDEVLEAASDAAFLDSVVARVQAWCAPHKAPLAVGLIKRAVQSGLEMPLDAGLTLERELQARLFASADSKEGIAAFNEKRQANFTGR